MRFATLLVGQDLRDGINQALYVAGIEVFAFSAVDAILSASQAFDAILVEDDALQIEHWLSSLQHHAPDPFALIAVGTGGAAAMSRALLHGADDYIVVQDGTEQLVQRTIARAASKIQRRPGNTWQLGPYTLDASQRTLSSVAITLHLSPREALLGTILLENLGRVVQLDQLCSELCGRTDESARRAVKQLAHTFRKKCREVAGSSTNCLRVESVYGRGYRITP